MKLSLFDNSFIRALISSGKKMFFLPHRPGPFYLRIKRAYISGGDFGKTCFTELHIVNDFSLGEKSFTRYGQCANIDLGLIITQYFNFIPFSFDAVIL